VRGVSRAAAQTLAATYVALIDFLGVLGAIFDTGVCAEAHEMTRDTTTAFIFLLSFV
jgi:hypothetical protein